MLNVCILIYDGVELLDFSGPYSVFSMINKFIGNEVQVFTTYKENSIITAQNGLKVIGDIEINESKKRDIDILIIPGGQGSRKYFQDEDIKNFILENNNRDNTKIVSVCTGALFLANAGLLRNLEITTHKSVFEIIKEIDPTINISQNKAIVDNNKILLSGGVCRGIDISLYLIKKIYGDNLSDKIKNHIEYFSK